MTNARLSLGSSWLLFPVSWAILLFLIFPTVVVVVLSFSPSIFLDFPPKSLSLKWFYELADDPSWLNSGLFSLKIAFLTTIVSLIAGTAAAIAVVRSNLPGKQLFMACVLIPLIVPHIVVAIAVYLQFAQLGLVGNTLGFVLVHAALTVPYVILMVSAALQRLPVTYEMAALNLGATRQQCFRKITLPLITPAVLGSGVLVFVTSFDESVVSYFLSGVTQKTITRRLFEEIDYNISPIIAAASTAFIIITVGLMAMLTIFRRRES
ncbi:ABC transporter permease [Rhizobium terrae]|uniref:ABC transporter permease n=1 Tax=Rhizobium terrae TaxID=2171756 RepID=UPI000E3DF9A2|nr:ABC transporter permease [Rhizobium terrae]